MLCIFHRNYIKLVLVCKLYGKIRGKILILVTKRVEEIIFKPWQSTKYVFTLHSWISFILGKRLCIGSLDQVQSLTQLSLADCRLVPCPSLVLLIYLQFRSSLDSLVNFNQTCYWQKRKFG